jgi:hypothetical protein
MYNYTLISPEIFTYDERSVKIGMHPFALFSALLCKLRHNLFHPTPFSFLLFRFTKWFQRNGCSRVSALSSIHSSSLQLCYFVTALSLLTPFAFPCFLSINLLVRQTGAGSSTYRDKRNCEILQKRIVKERREEEACDLNHAHS